jgi:hypothetical protein
MVADTSIPYPVFLCGGTIWLIDDFPVNGVNTGYGDIIVPQ